MKNSNYKIIVLTALVLLTQSCSVVGYFNSKKEVTGDYVTELKPVDKKGHYDMSINVIQGIASFENGWFTAQTSAEKYLLINYLNEKGESEFDFRLNTDSHGQDLSLEQISENKLYLYTTVGHFDKKESSGIIRMVVELPEKVNSKRDMSQTTIKIDKTVHLNLINATPTLSEDKQHFAIRSNNSIVVDTKENVLANNLSNAMRFDIDKGQLKDDDGKVMWFQGIAMKGGKVYCLTGNSTIGSVKKIYTYTTEGVLLTKKRIEKDELAKQLHEKIEPEGLTFVNDDLYYTIMIKDKTGGNRKFLFKV